MPTCLAAIWGPDDAALARLPATAVVRRALADQGRLAAGDPFDALVTAPDAPRALDRLGARVWAWTVESHHPGVGQAPCDVTMVALMRRRPDLTHDAFAAHWTRKHAPLALVHHVGLHDYVQHVVTATLTRGADEIDGVAALGFRTREDFETRFYDSDDGRRVIGEDVRRFMAGPGPDTTLLAPPA
jgi:hypothetical protein